MVRLLTATEAVQVQKLRLLSLQTDADFFGSTYDYECRYSPNYYQQRISAIYKPPLFGYWGIFKDQLLVGYTQLVPEALPRMDHIANLYELYIDPNFRRHGLASELLAHLLELNHQMSLVEQIRLKVLSNNTVALNLYLQLGFKHIATIPSTIKHPAGYWDENLLIYYFGDE